MTKYDYLTKLKHYLQPLPTKERNAAMKYYEKYFNDASNKPNNFISYKKLKALMRRNSKIAFGVKVKEKSGKKIYLDCITLKVKA